MRNVIDVFPAVIAAGEGLGLIIAKPFQLDAAGRAGLHQHGYLVTAQPLGTELDRGADIEFLLPAGRNHHPGHGAQPCGKRVIEHIPP